MQDLPMPAAWRGSAARWMVTFAGFPLGGFAAHLLAGPVGNAGAALLGGLITGAVLGAVQVWGLGRNRPSAGRWVAATAIGFAVGLGAGAAAVDYATDLTAVLLVGGICGAAVGAAQALVLRPLLGRWALAWPLLLAAVWTAGWAVSTAIGVRIEEGFTVFGSSGALLVTALTAVLPIAINRTAVRQPATGSAA
jgi:hypothetical protein